MKIRHLLAAAVLATLSLQAAAQPAPARRTDLAGEFRLTPTTLITCTQGLEPLADYLCEYLPLAGSSIRFASDNALVLALDPSLGEEAYRLDIANDHILIEGGAYGGVFNGIQQLFRLLPPEVYARRCQLPLRLPALHIEDAPRFAYRGMMLDVARTWVDAPHVKRYIDLLSYHNINKLHLHLSDDEGWRIEILSHPELTEIGGFRGGDSPVRPIYGKWDEKYGGYYTQQQMRDLIAYAAARNIEIIPEIDLPGHSRNIASVHPEIRCNYRPDTVSTCGYDYRSVWCVAREENYRLLEDIMSEICALFPSPYIHIGGDEVDASQWERCPDCRALMERRGITDPHRLEDLFMQRMSDILSAHGKRPALWNEAVKRGGPARTSRVHGWENVRACLDATDKGYPTVVMPASSFYLDMRQSPHEDGHSWAAVFDARTTYGFDFDREGFTPERMRHVVGLEAAFWSEAYVSHEPEKPDYLDYMCFPRLCALSRLAWSGNEEGWERYYGQLTGEHYDRMTAMGIRFRLFPPTVTYGNGTLAATTDDGSTLYYLEEGSTEEQRYTGPIETAQPHRYRFFTRRGTGRSPEVADRSAYRTISPAWKLSSSIGISERFPASNAERYRGMTRTTRTCRPQDWLLYTFDTPLRCRELFLQTGYKQLPNAHFVSGYAEVSYDGIRFERAGTLDKGCFTLRPTRPVKAVRLVATCRGNSTPFVVIQPPVVKPEL